MKMSNKNGIDNNNRYVLNVSCFLGIILVEKTHHLSFLIFTVTLGINFDTPFLQMRKYSFSKIKIP